MCQKNYSCNFGVFLAKRYNTEDIKTLKTLGFSRVKVAQEEGLYIPTAQLNQTTFAPRLECEPHSATQRVAEGRSRASDCGKK